MDAPTNWYDTNVRCLGQLMQEAIARTKRQPNRAPLHISVAKIVDEQLIATLSHNQPSQSSSRRSFAQRFAAEWLEFQEVSAMFENNHRIMVPRNFKWHYEPIQIVETNAFDHGAFELDPDHVYTKNRVMSELIMRTVRAWREKKFIPIQGVILNVLVRTMTACIEKAGTVDVTTIESLKTVLEVFTKLRVEVFSGFSRIYSKFYSNPARMLGSTFLPEEEEEESYEENRDRLQIERCTNELIRIIVIRVLWPLLLTRIFNDDVVNVAIWQNALDRGDTVRQILSSIKTRGRFAFNSLVQCLHETSYVPGHARAADLLERKICFSANEPGPSHTTLSGPTISDEERELYEIIALIRSDKRLVIDVTSATRFMDVNDGGIVKNYKMSTNPRGRVLILTVAEYYNVQDYRNAAVHDRRHLCDLFCALGFEVIAPDSGPLTASEIIRHVREFSQRDFSDVDSCFVIISGHGAATQYNGTLETEIYGYDCRTPGTQKVLCRNIVDMFSIENCPQLEDKPKVFIFQTCRELCRLKSEDGNIAEDLLIPQEYSDTLIVHSTMPGRVAYCNGDSGSYYITILCYVFMHYACNSDIETLLKKVQVMQKKVVAKINATQVPTVKDIYFDKKLYFNPGIEKNL